MKKSIFIVCMTILVSLFAGCSKREQIVSGTGGAAILGAGVSFLRDHFKRNNKRKRKLNIYQNFISSSRIK